MKGCFTRYFLCILGIFNAVTLMGCGHLETHHVLFRQPPSPTSEAQLFLETLPNRPYQEVGIVQAIGYGANAELGRVLAALQARAKPLGCNAIVRVRVDSGMNASHGIGVCVVWISNS